MRGLLVGQSVRARPVAWQRFTAGRRDFPVGRRTHNALCGDLHAGVRSMRRTAALGLGIVCVVTRGARTPARAEPVHTAWDPFLVSHARHRSRGGGTNTGLPQKIKSGVFRLVNRTSTMTKIAVITEETKGVPVMQMLCIATLFREMICEKCLILLGEIEVERVKGIEPSSQPWEGHILPLNHTRIPPTAYCFINSAVVAQLVIATSSKGC